VFPIENGVPLITERSLSGSWRFAVGEIIAFLNGARDIDEIESYGCGPRFWGAYRGMGSNLGLAPNDMGPGSYGAVFHDYERADGTKLNQYAQLVEHIREYPHVRTHKVTNWRPDYTAEGPNRKVIIAPCHGDVHVRIFDNKLCMMMNQRSGDFPVGVPHNMIQYAALFLMLCQVTGYEPSYYSHCLGGDIHIYEDQMEDVEKVLNREPRPFPIMHLDPMIKNLFDFRVEHFSIEEYDPHPSIRMQFSP
jgi:thymidylate synthase